MHSVAAKSQKIMEITNKLQNLQLKIILQLNVVDLKFKELNCILEEHKPALLLFCDHDLEINHMTSKLEGLT